MSQDALLRVAEQQHRADLPTPMVPGNLSGARIEKIQIKWGSTLFLIDSGGGSFTCSFYHMIINHEALNCQAVISTKSKVSDIEPRELPPANS